ncbi:MAG: hypothetical protein HOV80_17640 [Polyangiaceae bacterium]|nr:hypothetical protein [Polyangiaceae bacterium]
MIELYTWVLAALLQFAPPDRLPQYPGYEETLEQTQERYADIAGVISSVALAEEEAPDGMTDREEAALLVAIAVGETHLALDADRGPCFRDGRFHERCDRGRAASIWQVHAWKRNGEWVPLSELFENRELAAERAFYVARSSLGMCKHLPPEDRLSGLSGRCIRGLASAQAHYRRWMKLRAWEPKKPPPEVAQR